MKQRLLQKMRGYFGEDQRRIGHAESVLAWAERLLEHEQAERHIVVPAAVLHDIGIKVAEEKYGSSAGPYQEKEGPPIAREILQQLGFNAEEIQEICDIIAHHHSPGKVDSLNFKVLYDADWLVNLQEVAEKKTPEQLRRMIGRIFLTETGKRFAMVEYLGEPAGDPVTPRTPA